MEMESTVMAVDDIAKKLKKSKARDLKKEDDSSDEDEGEAANEDDINRMENFTSLPGDLIEVDLKKNDYGFGLALAGHCNRNRMGTYICGIHPQGSACEDGRLQVGDELLKVWNYAKLFKDYFYQTRVSAFNSRSTKRSFEAAAI